MCRDAMRAFEGHCMAPGQGGHYFIILLHDMDDLLAFIHPLGLAMFSGDVVESMNRILKRAYSDHSNRSGGKTAATGFAAPDSVRLQKDVDGHASVLAQCLQWVFLYFHIHLVCQGKVRATRCNVAEKFEKWELEGDPITIDTPPPALPPPARPQRPPPGPTRPFSVRPSHAAPYPSPSSSNRIHPLSHHAPLPHQVFEAVSRRASSSYGVLGIWGYRDMGIQGYGDTGIWGYRDMGIQGYGDTGIWGYRDMGIQGVQRYGDIGIWGYRECRDTGSVGIQGYGDADIWGYRDVGMQRYGDTQIWGYRDTSIQGYHVIAAR